MAYEDPTHAAQEAIAALSSSQPEKEEFYSELSNLITSKLYHQLTVAILEFTSVKSNHKENNFFILFDVLSSIKATLNPLVLARIAWNVAQTSSRVQEGTEALTKLISSVEDDTDAIHAKLYAEAKLHLIHMSDPDMDVEKVKSFLKDNDNTLKELSSSTESEVAIVHSAYYQTAMELHRKVGPAESFYKQAINFLNYTPLASVEDVNGLARDLSLAALVGKGVYNLGTVVYENSELLAHLKNSDDAYLVELMESAASGDVAAIKTLEAKRSQLEANGCDIKIIQEKIMLLALVHMVFERDSNDRKMLFSDISERLQVDQDQVEWIIIKALSLNLIKGSMDQVDGAVDITWVMPRVLDANTMKALSERLGEWAAKVSQTREFMGERIPAF